MSNKTYDILKDIAQLWLPTISVLYATLASIWGFPYVEAIVGTLAGVDAALGAILKYFSAQYNKTLTSIDYEKAVKKYGEPPEELEEVAEQYPEG